jgi:hypothetical protein
MIRPIITISNDKYILGTAVLLKSIINNTNLEKILFFILYDKDQLSVDNIKKFHNIFLNNKNIKIKFVTSNTYEKNKEKIKNIYADSIFDSSIWLKIFIDEVFYFEVKEIIYIDSDSFFIKNCDDFFNFQLNKPIAAQLDYGSGTSNANPIYPYFNSGIYILSLEYWKKNKILNLFLNELDFKKYKFPDQDFLNIVFKNNWQLLGTQINVARDCLAIENYIMNKTNVMNKNSFMFHDDPIHVHFMGAPKPWESNYLNEVNLNWRLQGELIKVDYLYFNLLKEIKTLW